MLLRRPETFGLKKEKGQEALITHKRQKRDMQNGGSDDDDDDDDDDDNDDDVDDSDVSKDVEEEVSNGVQKNL